MSTTSQPQRNNLPSRARGRPEHEPTEQTRKTVEIMVACGIKQDVIADALGVSDVTLRKHYARELQHGMDAVAARVANALVDKALSDRPDAVNAAKFYLQARAGWAERQEQKLTGAIYVNSGVPRANDGADTD